MDKPNITAEALRKVLDYNKATGIFKWKTKLSLRTIVGDVAGCLNSDGYICIGIYKKLYVAHRLVFLYVTGKFPCKQVDHRNGIRTDNRWKNLRDVSQKENAQNIRRATANNKYSTLLGATFERLGRRQWRARIKIGGKNVSLGSFDTPEEAHKVYVIAKRKHHAGCTI